MELIDTLDMNRCTCKVYHKARISPERSSESIAKSGFDADSLVRTCESLEKVIFIHYYG